MAISIVEQGNANIFRQTINDNFSFLNTEAILASTKIYNLEKMNPIVDNGPPSESTQGEIGQIYIDTKAQKIYYCVENGFFEPGERKYIWKSASGSTAIISSDPPENIQSGDVWYQIV